MAKVRTYIKQKTLRKQKTFQITNDVLIAGAKLSSKDIQPGTPFEPTGVYKMLHVMKYDAEFKVIKPKTSKHFKAGLRRLFSEAKSTKLRFLAHLSTKEPLQS